MRAHIESGFKHLAYGIVIVLRHIMLVLDIYKLHRLTVAHHIPVGTDFIPEKFHKKSVYRRNRLSFHSL